LAASLLAITGQVQAQTGTTDEAAIEGATDADIVVTGTFIRGLAPVGVSTVGLSAEDIVKTGVSDSTQLLAKIPQLNSFGQLPTPIGTQAGIVRPPLIRDLPTLVLFDGQRMAPVGLLSSDANVNAIPPSLIERVDVIPGGGSALYGSDAIGGVVNFMPVKRLDGFKFSAHAGVGENYDTRGGDIAFGTNWNNGGLILAYSYDHHSDLSGADRDWYTQDPLGVGFGETRCDPGNVFAGGQTYAMPSLTPGAANCNLNAYNDIYPDYNRHSFYGAIRQDFSNTIHFDLSGYYAHERLKSRGAGFFANTNRSIQGGVITNANPYFRPIAGETSQTFDQTIGAAGEAFGLGRNNNAYTTMGITPKLTIDLPAGFRAIASFNYGRSEVWTRTNTINNAAFASALASSDPATAYNPYDPSSNNQGVLAAIFGSVASRSHGIQTFTQSRLVFDGSLFALPGGDAKVAFGYERQHNRLRSGNVDQGAYNAPVPFAQGTRDIDSFFGEIALPVVGGDSGRPGLERLELSAAVRHDKYSDGFSSTNPKFGLTYTPVDGLNIRASWGKSFHAPDLAFLTGPTLIQVVPAGVFPLPGISAGGALQNTFLIVGANPGNISPETSRSWQIGADFTPASVPGLKLSATYFDIKYNGKIDYPPIFPPTLAAAHLYTLNPTLAQLQEFVGNYPVLSPTINAGNLDQQYANGAENNPYGLILAYPTNQANIRQKGIDFNLQYAASTDFGGWRAGVNGSHYLSYKTTPIGAPSINTLRDAQPDWLFQASAGVTVGQFSGDVRVDYRDSAPLNTPALPKVDSFVTTNFFFSYDLGDLGPAKKARITLNVDNAFDVDPPRQLGALGVAFTNLGRVFTLGLNANF
jgi:iron complex outermembrane receptor protein